MVNVQVHEIILEDTEVEFKKPTPKLTERELGIDGVMKARMEAWNKIKEANGLVLLNDHEIKNLRSPEDPKLVEELGEEKSCLRMMGLDDYENEGKLGLVNTRFKFHAKHLPKVNHYIRGAQASFRLGRLTNLASSIMFISKNEIAPGSKAEESLRDDPGEGEEAIITPADVGRYSLGVRALLARARVRVNGDSDKHRKCRWLKKYPLYRHLFLSRPDGKTVAPNSENVNVCHTRRHKDAFKTVAEISGGRLDEDVRLFQEIDARYLLTAREKKNASRQRENDNKGVALGARVIKGKMHLVGSPDMVDGVNRLNKRVFRNVIEPFMRKLPDRRKNVDMCMDILLQHSRRVGVEDKDKNEDHLYPEDWMKEIDSIRDHMIDVGVTRVEVSLLSRALTLADNHTAAALRDEDTRGQNAFDLDVIEIPGNCGDKVRLVRCELPPFFKNRKAMQKKKTGCPVNHVKDDSCAEGFVVMVVIARRIMRKLLGIVWKEEEQKMRAEGKIDIEIDEAREKYALTQKLGPFSPSGQLYSSKQLGTLYEFCGAYTMGLPYYKSHVIRSIHATAVAKLCIRDGLAEDHPSTIKIFNAARQGDEERISAYSQAMSDMPNRDGIEFMWRSASSALNELNDPKTSVVAGSKEERLFQEFAKIGGFHFQGPEGDSCPANFGTLPSGKSCPMNFGWNKRCNDPLDELERKCREMELLARMHVARETLGYQPLVEETAGTKGGSERCKGVVRRKVEGPCRKNKKGKKMQDQSDRRGRLVAEMNRLFVKWAQSYRAENSSAKGGKKICHDIGRSKSITIVFAPDVRTEMANMEEHKAFFSEFFGGWNSKEACRKFASKVAWELP